MATAAINPNTPYGLQPVTRLDGAVTNFRMRKYFVPAGNTNALYLGDPVVKITTTADVNGVMGVDLATAGTSNRVTGAVMGFLGTSTAGTGNVPAFWPPINSGPAYRPASTALDYYILVCDDPEAEFLIQANANFGGSSGTAIPVTSVGQNFNLLSGTGSAYTGWSGWQLNSNSTGTTNTYQLNLVGFLVDSKNQAVAQFQKCIVRLNQATETTPTVGI